MTCIIAARASNGVVLAADRLEVQGSRTRKRDKILAFPSEGETSPMICTGFAGITGFRDKLWSALRTHLSAGLMTGGLDLLDDVIIGMEDVVSSLFDRYGERLTRSGRPARTVYGSLTVGLESLGSGKGSIRKLHPQGFSERIYDYDGIGSAGPHGVSLLRLVHKGDETVDELAKSCIATILLIEEMGIDRNVGGIPDVVKVKDEKGINTLSREEVKKEVKGIERKSLMKSASESLRNAFEKWIKKAPKEQMEQIDEDQEKENEN